MLDAQSIMFEAPGFQILEYQIVYTLHLCTYSTYFLLTIHSTHIHIYVATKPTQYILSTKLYDTQQQTPITIKKLHSGKVQTPKSDILANVLNMAQLHSSIYLLLVSIQSYMFYTYVCSTGLPVANYICDCLSKNPTCSHTN